MSDQRIANLEARLEKITEGFFAHLFGQRIHAHDIALQLVRALESHLEPASNGDLRPVAPDHYVIRTHPDVLRQISERYPALSQILSDQIVELASNSGYRLANVPKVEFAPAAELSTHRIMVSADHLARQQSTTAAMQPVRSPVTHTAPKNAQIVISGQMSITLDTAIITIGRSRQNDIVLSDSYVSRAHAQIRLRFGHYTIFDTSSQSGTFVNDVRIQEHRLQTGDIIRIGNSSLVYLEDEPDSVSQTGILHLD